MNHISKYTIAASLLFGLSGFNSAKAITVEELQVVLQNVASQLSQAIGGMNQRLNNLENRISSLEFNHPNLGGYSMPFAADNAPKNVVVARQEMENGDIQYSVRSRYATSTEQISIDGVLTQRPFIANYATVLTDSLGNLLFVNNYIEAPDTSNYIDFNVEQSDYDPVGLVKTVTDDTLFEKWNLCAGSENVVCMPDVTLSATGEHVRTYAWSSTRGVSGPLSINGMNFADVRLEQSISSDYARARAFGVGEVLRAANDGSWERRVIFYRVDGDTGGSLAGTPFAPGLSLDGLFF